MINEGLYSSASSTWETPPDVFAKLDKEFHFTLDVCASRDNLGLIYFSPEVNGLAQNWGTSTCFMNPPYGKEINEWVRKAFYASRSGATVVGLLPARTDTMWFHTYVYPHADLVFIKGRLKFWEDGKPSKNSAPFPSMVAIWRPKH